MSERFASAATFVDLHFVEETYHELHSQLLHRHADVLELLYVMKGEGQYIVDGRQYIVRPGSLVICNADVLHGEPPFQGHRLESYCCVLRDLALPGLPPNTLTQADWNPVVYFLEDRAAVEHILFAMRDLSIHSAPHTPCCGLLANALLQLVRGKLVQRQQHNEATDRNNEEFIRGIMQYLDTHFTEPIQLASLGERFHISPFYLSHLFKAGTGLSPMKYAMHRKIGESQNMLMNTTLPIGAISDALGFHDHCHFSATFKKYVGLTPTQYREHFQ